MLWIFSSQDNLQPVETPRIMENSHYPLTEDQIRFFQEKGYLLIRSFLGDLETRRLQQWTQEVHDLPRTPDASYMPYEVRPRQPIRCVGQNPMGCRLTCKPGSKFPRPESSLSHRELRQQPCRLRQFPPGPANPERARTISRRGDASLQREDQLQTRRQR